MMGNFNKYFLWFIISAQLVLFFVVMNDPFHGDAIASTARAALHIYDTNLQTIFYPTNYDPGHPTLFPYILAMCWIFFGKSLWVAHALVTIVCILTLFVFRKIATIYLNASQTNFATLLFSVYSIYVSQCALLLNTPMFFLLALSCFYSLLKNKKYIFISSSILMELTHLQSNFMLLSFFGIFTYHYFFLANEKPKRILQFVKQSLNWFSPAILVFGIWVFLHKQHTSWAIFSPLYTEHDKLKSISQFLQSMAIIVWRLFDYGMVAIYFFITLFISQKKYNKELVAFFLIALLSSAVCMGLFLYNTIGHRYFLFVQLLAILIFVDALGRTNCNKKLLIAISLICLFLGNFLFYPGKNLGDGTILYRSFFELEKKLKNDFVGQTIYSYAPLSSESKFRHLNNNGIDFIPLNEVSIDTVKIIFQSNINAEFTKPQKDFLQNNWYGNTYENGAVYVNVFLNPKYFNKDEKFRLRELSGFEKWILDLKYKWRGE